MGGGKSAGRFFAARMETGKPQQAQEVLWSNVREGVSRTPEKASPRTLPKGGGGPLTLFPQDTQETLTELVSERVTSG